MSTQSEILRTKGNIEAAYTACSDKGATLLENPNPLLRIKLYTCNSI